MHQDSLIIKCLESFDLKLSRKIGEGFYAMVFSICKKEDCTYVAKVFTKGDLAFVKNEFIVQKYVAAHGLTSVPHGIYLCVSEGLQLIVMDFIDGLTLDELLRGVQVESDRIIHIMNALDVIKKLNNLGVRHNDVHQKNIMMNKQGISYIIDFGKANFDRTLYDERRDLLDSLIVNKDITEKEFGLLLKNLKSIT